MSEMAIARELLEYGLTEPESRIYIYLAKKGATPAGEIARALDIRRGQTYSVLKALQEKGIVETVAGKPTKFSGLPFPKALNVLVQAQKQRQQLMERLKPELLSMWQSVLPAGIEEVEEEKFQFLKGVESIYRKASEIIDLSKSQVTMVAPERALYHADRFGVIDQMNKASKRNVMVKLIAEMTPRTKEIEDRMKQIPTKGFINHSPPHFLISDGKQIIFLTSPMESVDPKEANAIWTNSSMLVGTMQHFFENMWESERPEPGIPVSEPDKGKLSEMERQRIEMIREEYAKHIAVSGFQVEKDYALVGNSGAEYIFSLALLRGDEKPTVIDFEVSNEPITSMRVIEFFAKRLDVESLVKDATLVVKPRLDSDAQKLATFYRMKVTELG